MKGTDPKRRIHNQNLPLVRLKIVGEGFRYRFGGLGKVTDAVIHSEHWNSKGENIQRTVRGKKKFPVQNLELPSK